MHFVKSETKKIILIEWGIDIFQLGKNKKRNAGNGLAKLGIKLWTIAHNVLRVGDVALCCACGKAILLTRC